MEIISGRRNGKKKELLKKIEEMLDRHEIVLAFNSKQLQERDRQIREMVCKTIREALCMTNENSICNTANCVYYDDLNAVLERIEKGE